MQDPPIFRPDEFKLRIGFTLNQIKPSARRHESKPEFKRIATQELQAVFKPEWIEKTLKALGEKLPYDSSTGYVDDGDLQNAINAEMQALEIQTTDFVDRGCYYDRHGCWWKVRTFGLVRTFRVPEGRVDELNWTCEEAAQTYGGGLPPGTRRDLASLPYVVCVEWRVCPPPEEASGSDPVG